MTDVLAASTIPDSRAERCRSGLTGMIGNHVWQQCHRGFEFLSLRHFFASQLAKQGATQQQIERLLCHVSTSVPSRYVHQDIEDLSVFVEELSNRFLARDGLYSCRTR